MSAIQEFVTAHRQEALEELQELLTIPSVSTDPQHKADVERCAEWVHKRLESIGLDVETLRTPGHPVVYAERIVDESRPTVLVYGHYDVQPPDPLNEWRHGPFSPTVEGEFLVARGATDDKGQFYALVKGIQAASEVFGEVPTNVKGLIEGEEEVGSIHLAPLVTKEKERLKSDVVLIADSSQFARDVPAITYGLKGLCYVELTVRGAKTDLHSGSYGGAVANPANVLTRMVSACQGTFGRVGIPGFYDDVRDIEDWEREAFKQLEFDEEKFRQELDVKKLFGEEGFSSLERRWARPTFDVNGLISGFTGEGAKTVLPCEARAKFSMRLVPDQDPEKIAELVTDFLHEIAPESVKIEVSSLHGARPVLVPRQGKSVQAAERALTHAFGREPVFIREGGSIPVVNTFKEELGIDSLLIGLGLPDDGAHAPNERFRIEDYYRGIVTMASLLEELAK